MGVSCKGQEQDRLILNERGNTALRFATLFSNGGIMRVVTLLAAFMLISGSVFADEQASAPIVADGSSPDGSVSLSATSLAAGVGWVWGNGKLKFNGKEHRFKISGLTVVDGGISSISAAGEVYNLRQLSDFGGNYTVASAGIAIGGGAGASYLKNEHGVVIKLVETNQGLRVNLAAEGVTITLRT
jgi:hypothetical protein